MLIPDDAPPSRDPITTDPNTGSPEVNPDLAQHLPQLLRGPLARHHRRQHRGPCQQVGIRWYLDAAMGRQLRSHVNLPSSSAAVWLPLHSDAVFGQNDRDPPKRAASGTWEVHYDGS